jgi:hypothetical protein
LMIVGVTKRSHWKRSRKLNIEVLLSPEEAKKLAHVSAVITESRFLLFGIPRLPRMNNRVRFAPVLRPSS